MIQLSLLAFVINGMFVNMEYFDLPYHWVSVTACLKVIVNRELAGANDDMSYVSAPIQVAATQFGNT